MEKRDSIESTAKSIYEGSGEDILYQTTPGIDEAISRAGEIFLQNEVKFVRAKSNDFVGYTAKAQTTMAHNRSDITYLLQTNVLLVAVLIICFITLASVFAICFCMIRCYRKSRRHPQTVATTTAISKATSITGLNVAHQYYSTKVEKRDDYAPTVAVHSRCEKAISCELGANNRSVGNDHSILTNTNPGEPSEQPNSENAPTMYFKGRNMFTSTPTRNQVYSTNVRILSKRSSQNVLTVRYEKLASSSSTQEHSSIELASALNDSNDNQQEDSVQPVEENSENAVPAQQLTHSHQSISWFVPLNGSQNEPLRHSIIETTRNDANNKDNEGTASDKNSDKTRLSEDKHVLLSELHEDNVAALASRSNSCKFDPNHGAAEDIPLMEKCSNLSNSAPTSVVMKRSRLTSALSEERGFSDSTICCPRSQSFSPDYSNAWKQREDRPVLFLGTGVK